MTSAVAAMTGYAFEEFPFLVRIFAVPYVRNPASSRVLEKAGYVREGILRKSAIKEGEILDQAIYARIRG
jgi:[ribosomal protein S5]-alanine N-acetyltransferase